MRRTVVWLGVLALVVTVGCSTPETGPVPAWDVADCIDPPDLSDRSVESEIIVTLTPTTVIAGEVMTMTVELAFEPDDPDLIGLGDGTTWQCWIDGEGWVVTHILTKGGGEAVPWLADEEGTANTVEGWGGPIPSTWTLRVPSEVHPGIYQVVEPAWDTTGWIDSEGIATFVEVVDE